MATAYTPEEITEIFEAWADAVKSGTPISEELSKQMSDAAKQARGLARAQEEFGKSLGKSVAQLGSSLYKGEKGVGQFGDAIESAGAALQTLILAIPGLGLVAKAAAVGIGLFAKGINMASKQGDALFKTYQDLNRVGATASDGISGVFNNMQKFGYGIEELDKMVQLVAQNSETLAQFSLTAADGTKSFAEGMSRIQRDGQLRDLGKTTDDINSAGAAFIRQQVLMGRRQSDMQGDLGTRTKAYVLELDRLQRLTGTSADALQKKQEELMQEDAYLVYLEMLEEQGEEGRKQAEKIRAVTSNLEPQYAKMVAQAIGGNVEAQQQLAFLMPNLIKDLRDPAKSYADIMKTAGQDITKFKGVFRENYLLDPSMAEFGSNMSAINKQLARTKDTDARDQAARENAEVLDNNTKRLSEAQIANMNSRDAMQAFINQGIAPATIATGAFADVVEGLTSILPGGSRPGKGMNTAGYGAQGTGTRGGSVGSMAAGAAAGAAIGSVVPVVGTGIGAAIGAAAGYLGYGALGGAGDKPEDYLKFNGESGSKDAFSKLDPDIQRRLMAAGKQYKDITGNMLTINSAFRDSQKQKELYDAWVARGKTGMPVAPPGNSSHEKGLAVDIQQYRDQQAVASLNAAGLFQTVANDPVHFSRQNGYRYGGIATGPSSGYQTTLHGTEAIVPLPNGKTIPVEIPGFSANFADQTSLMSAQLGKLDELVRVMQNQVNLSTKILQAAH